ncbi:MAG: hypothetical protein RSJ41_07480 [Clostridia bacterium]
MKNTMKVLVVMMMVLAILTGASALADKKGSKPSVKVVMENKGELNFGDTVTLKAVVKNAGDAAYTLSWEVKEGSKSWKTLNEDGATYSFEVTEQNQNFKYRVALVTAD